jgi:hypothetical protein
MENVLAHLRAPLIGVLVCRAVVGQ